MWILSLSQVVALNLLGTQKKKKRASSLFKLGNHTVCPSESQGRQEGVGYRWDWFNEGFWNNGVCLLSGPPLAHF